jgi:hypothetical protein
MKWQMALLFVLLTGVACSSTGGEGSRHSESEASYDDDAYYIPDGYDADTSASGEAYAADPMHFRKPVPNHSGQKSWEFFFKHCSMNGNESYYSKTSYDCSGPYAQ